MRVPAGGAASGPAGAGAVPDLAILMGLQASGKTTFYRRRLAATHVHVSKDLWPNARRRQARQLRLIAEALQAGLDVAVDNTDPSPAEWEPLIAVGRRCGARITGYWFPPDVPATLRRNAERPPRLRVPDVGIFGTLRRLRRPRLSDGFDELWSVRPAGGSRFVLAALPDEEGVPDG